MTRGLCEGCARMTIISNKHIERCENEEVKKITKNMYFCSNQCRIKWRNTLIKFLNIKRSFKVSKQHKDYVIKLKTEQEIKQQADKEAEEYHPLIKDIDPDKYFVIIESFYEGASWLQREVLASASEGFEEWENKTIQDNGGSFPDFIEPEDLWQACSLYHAKKMQEKDAEIEALTKEKDAWKTMYLELRNRVAGA